MTTRGAAEPVVTAVLCVRNGAATLDRQLDALAAQDFTGSWELVFVNNGSTDDTRFVAQRAVGRIPGMRIVDEPRVGLNRARNCGVAAARSALILLCDADDEVSPSWVRAMLEGLQRSDVVGGALEADKLNGSSPMRAMCLQRRALPMVLGYEYAVGANLGFARRVFEAVGGFDEDYRGGFDEVDFCVRAHLGGFAIGFVPTAVVHYRTRDTARDVIRQRLGYGAGYQRLIAKEISLGVTQQGLRSRWRTVGVNAMSVLRQFPRALNQRTRLPYIANLAFIAGQISRLTVESASVKFGRYLPPIWSIFGPIPPKIDQIRGYSLRRAVGDEQ